MLFLQSLVEEEVVRLAQGVNLVTPHTAAVAVLLRSNPLDITTVKEEEVPLQVSKTLLSTEQTAQLCFGCQSTLALTAIGRGRSISSKGTVMPRSDTE